MMADYDNKMWEAYTKSLLSQGTLQTNHFITRQVQEQPAAGADRRSQDEEQPSPARAASRGQGL